MVSVNSHHTPHTLLSKMYFEKFRLVGHINRIGQSLFEKLFKTYSQNCVIEPKVQSSLQMTSKFSESDPNHLIWVDCEMSGLNLEKDKLLEIAVIITDNNIVEKDRLGPLVLHQDQETLDSMDEWCKKTHGNSNLISKCLQSQLTTEMVDKMFAEKLNKHSIRGGVLAGNSVSVDSFFIRKYLPKTSELLHYHLLDVSSIKQLKNRWYPLVPEFKKAKKHEAMSDIIESLNELKYYRSNLFK